jgi:hypothetical protein
MAWYADLHSAATTARSSLVNNGVVEVSVFHVSEDPLARRLGPALPCRLDGPLAPVLRKPHRHELLHHGHIDRRSSSGGGSSSSGWSIVWHQHLVRGRPRGAIGLEVQRLWDGNFNFHLDLLPVLTVPAEAATVKGTNTVNVVRYRDGATDNISERKEQNTVNVVWH